MTLRNFDTDLDIQGVTRTTSVRITETVTTTPRPSEGRTFLVQGEWGWDALRDYVVAEIEARFGAFPRDGKKEYGIFTSFVGRWGSDAAQAIARYAFEVCDGRWAGAPISVTRFCKGSDPFFGAVIAQRIGEVGAKVEPW